MNKILFGFLFIAPILFFQKTYAQNFEEGYIVTIKNDTLRGFIREKEYGGTSFVIRFKKRIADHDPFLFKPSQITSYYLKQFGETYISRVVDLDVKPSRFGELENNGAPKFVRDTVFLKMLVKGKAGLYVYEDKTSKVHYFLQTERDEIKELIRVKFINIVTGALSENDIYREQLKQYLSACNQKYSNISYNESELEKVIVGYNDCVGSKSVFVQQDYRPKAIPYVFIGGSSAKGAFGGDDNYPQSVNVSDIKFTSPISPIVGAGIEMVPAKASKHLSEALEFLWTKYSFSGQTAVVNSAQKTASYAYSAGGLSISVKYSFNGKVKPYFKLGLSGMFISEQKNKMFYSSDIAGQNFSGPITTFSKTSFGYFAGFGVLFNRFFAEVRYGSTQISSTSNNAVYYTTSLNLIAGYRLKKL